VNEIGLVHGFTFFRSLGGVQSMLQRHWQGDAAWGVDSQFVAYFDPAEPGQERVRGLGLSWRHTIAQARRRFARAVPKTGPVKVYHNCWGLPFFAGLDSAQRRIGVLHSDWPGLPGCLRRVHAFVDGVLCVSQPLMGWARREWADWDSERVAFLPYPAGCAQVEITKAPLASRPLVVGFAGRLSREQKRVDRLPTLVRELDRAKLDYRFELLGDGPEAGWLRRQLAGHPRVIFHGRLSGEAYQSVLRGWDALVLVSDYEGLPIALLEALSVGVLPLYPRIGSGGDDYVARICSEFLYTPEDLRAVASALAKVRQLPAERVEALRARCGEVATPHLGDCYLRTFAAFVRRVMELPRVSRVAQSDRRFHFSDYCPFAVLRRTYQAGLWQAD
jgi:glycosyltransferase involved in cell wall biosynthesis